MAEMAQHVPRVFAYPLIEPLTYFELCREFVDHDSTIPYPEMRGQRQLLRFVHSRILPDNSIENERLFINLIVNQ